MLGKKRTNTGADGLPNAGSETTAALGRAREPASIRIVVADDQALDREGIRLLLETQADLRVVGSAVSPLEASELCSRLRPDVLLLDSGMCDVAGATAVSIVHARVQGIRILALAARAEERCLVLHPPFRRHPGRVPDGSARALATGCLELAVADGALGAIRRDALPEQLFRAIREVAAGNAWYEARTAARMTERARRGDRAGGQEALTPREGEVGALVADGFSNKEIAIRLGISEATVKKHLGRIFDKLGLQDRLQVGLFLLRNPLLVHSRVAASDPVQVPRGDMRLS